MMEHSGLGNPFFSVHEGMTNNRTMIDGKEVISFASYNYLGMSGDPAVSARPPKRPSTVTAPAFRPAGWFRAKRRSTWNWKRRIAEFLGTEDAVALAGGHATNETVIGHLYGPGRSDPPRRPGPQQHHSRSDPFRRRRRPFAHNDWQEADRLLSQFRHEYRRVLIAIEGVYSMDGDIPDLPKFIEVKKRHQAMLMIDEAHSIGVLGATGRGIGEYFGVDRRTWISGWAR